MEHEVEIANTPLPKPDGLHELGVLWWGGESYQMPPTPWRLLKFMWDKDSTKSRTLKSKCGAMNPARHAISQALSKVNKVLLAAKTPWVFEQNQGVIRRV